MAEALKNLYSNTYINQIALAINKEYPLFDVKAFTKTVINHNWQHMALKQRLRHITQTIHTYLPIPYPKQIKILYKVAPQFNGFTAMIFPDFVAVYGMADWETSLPALAYFTTFSSSEFAVRPFILANPKHMAKQHLLWSKDANHHVRRLASEGIRPRLPWAEALPIFKLDPTPILLILENLKADESLYVRKSVANCLNDISKDHAELVLEIAKKWLGKNHHTNWIVKHACRGLLKQGNATALGLFNINHQANVKAAHLAVNKTGLAIGEDIVIKVCVTNLENKEQQVRLEYKVYFVKSNGQTSPKIFQWRNIALQPNEQKCFEKKHAFMDLTTRKHYPGKHKLVVVVNGVETETVEFNLKPYSKK